jgi:hypothetical protein
MSNSTIFLKESKGIHIVIQLISKKLYNKNTPLFMKVHVHWMNWMKNQIIQKCQSLEILKERDARQRIHFKNHLIEKLCSMGSECLTLSVAHRCKKSSCQKTCLVVSILGFCGILYVSNYKPKYWYRIMYECENSPLSHELS